MNAPIGTVHCIGCGLPNRTIGLPVICPDCWFQLCSKLRAEALLEAAKVCDDRCDEIIDQHKPLGLMSNHATYEPGTLGQRIRLLLDKPSALSADFWKQLNPRLSVRNIVKDLIAKFANADWYVRKNGGVKTRDLTMDDVSALENFYLTLP